VIALPKKFRPLVMLLMPAVCCLATSWAAGQATTGPTQLDFGSAQIPELQQTRINVTSLPTVSLLSGALAKSNPQRRVQLAHDLGTCQTQTAIAPVVSLLSDPSADVRAEAAKSLAELGDRKSVDVLKDLSRDPVPAVRREALIAAGALGNSQAFPTALSDSDPTVSEAAAIVAATGTDETEIAKAFPNLSWLCQCCALQHLATDSLSIEPELMRQGFSGTASQKFLVLSVLAAQPITGSASALSPLLDDPRSVIRRAALNAMSTVSSPADRSRLAILMLSDPDFSVRRAASLILAGTPSKDAIAPLLLQLRIENQPLRLAAREALVAQGASVAPLAAGLLADPSPQIREDSSYILGRLGSRERFADHLLLLRDAQWSVAGQAADSLARIGDRRCCPQLLDLVKRGVADYAAGQDTPDLDTAIVNAILAETKLGDTSVLQATSSFINEKINCPPEIRCAAIYAFGILGDPSNAAVCQQLTTFTADPTETFATQLESIKALGHLRVGASVEALDAIARTASNLQLRWIAHWAVDRINKTTTPLDIPPAPWSADVCMTDLQNAASVNANRDPSIAGVLTFGPSFVPGIWTPLTVQFRNPGAVPLNGMASATISDGTSTGFVRLAASVPPDSAVNETAYGFFSPANQGDTHQSSSAISKMYWSEDSGQQIAQGEVAGLPVSWQAGSSSSAPNANQTIVLCIAKQDTVPFHEVGANPQDVAAFARSISTKLGCSIKSRSIGVQDAPRHPAGYASCRYVILTADPDSLDMAQRRALLDYVRQGGFLMFCGSEPRPGCWLTDLLPVYPLGTRQVTSLQFRGAAPVKCVGLVPITEADEVISADVHILDSDAELIHAAYRDVGLGRVLFTSFPINAIDPSDPSFAGLWANLLNLNVPTNAEVGSNLVPVLAQMTGISAPSIYLPMGVVTGFFAIALGGHLIAGSALRARAFGMMTGVAVAGFAALVGSRLMQSSSHEIHAAQISLLDLGPQGGGRQQELLAFTGTDDPDFGLTADANATLRPIESSEAEPVSLVQLPFACPRAGVHSTQIKRIWIAQSPVAPEEKVDAVATFAADGLTLTVDNHLGQSLKNPVLVWGAPWSCGDVERDALQTTKPARNAAGDYLDSTGIRTDTAMLRNKILSILALKDAAGSYSKLPPAPVLFAFAQQLPPNAHYSAVAVTKSQNVIRVPIRIQPPKPGSDLLIDGSFCSIVFGPGPVPPYDAQRNEWVSTNRTGQWLIGFAPPAELGSIRPNSITVKLDVSAPTQGISLRAGQCLGGAPAANSAGKLVAHWDRSISEHEVTFHCDDGDFDSAGRVWLLLQVDPGDSDQSQWMIRKFETAYQAIAQGTGVAGSFPAAN
jgi:HEAT repeat protein